MDKKEVIKRLAGLRVVEGIAATPPGSSPAGAGPAAAARLGAAIPESARDDLRLLQEAGWSIGSDPEAPFDFVLDPQGHLKIAGPALSVKFSPDLSEEGVKTVLAELDARVRRNLGFAPNSFLVETGKIPVLDVARLLNERADVLYAEPNLIEPIQSR